MSDYFWMITILGSLLWNTWEKWIALAQTRTRGMPVLLHLFSYDIEKWQAGANNHPVFIPDVICSMLSIGVGYSKRMGNPVSSFHLPFDIIHVFFYTKHAVYDCMQGLHLHMAENNIYTILKWTHVRWTYDSICWKKWKEWNCRKYIRHRNTIVYFIETSQIELFARNSPLNLYGLPVAGARRSTRIKFSSTQWILYMSQKYAKNRFWMRRMCVQYARIRNMSNNLREIE